jgi:hypothetical protein
VCVCINLYIIILLLLHVNLMLVISLLCDEKSWWSHRDHVNPFCITKKGIYIYIYIYIYVCIIFLNYYYFKALQNGLMRLYFFWDVFEC